MGWNRDGVVAVCAWDRNLWWNDADTWFVREHAAILDLLDVDVQQVGPRTEIRWTEQEARAFQLLHILPHELGHHRDQFTTRTQRSAARGETYAEAYALRTMEAIWPDYTRTFGI